VSAGAVRRPRRRDLAAALAAGGLVAAVVAVVLSVAGDGPAAVGPPVQPQAATATATKPATAPLAGPLPLPAARSVVATTVTIPAIGVVSSLERLDLGADHVLQPPRDYHLAGWYASGPVPGDTGPAVIAGHVDSTSGPAVFARLGSLRRGDLVMVARSDGRTARFAVVSLETYSKDAFPSASVYGPTPVPTLRLITCGGSYDHAHHRYPDDVVVFAQEL
jgi:sortase (surface protein transpeptidase)